MKKEIDTAVILSTPFQALCAVEALRYFGVMNYSLYILNVGRKSGTNGTKEILDYYHISFKELTYDSFRSFITQLHRRKDKFTRFILGDYFYGFDMYILAAWMSKRKPEFIYVDDGNCNLLIDYMELSLKDKIRKILANVFLIGKGKSNKRMFSIFDIHTSKFPIIRNEMKLLKVSSIPSQSGIYIIATISGHPDLGWYNLQWFKEIKKYIALHFPNETVYYCPHRRDKNPFLASWVKEVGFEYYETEGNVEFDFIRKNINPKTIIGFGSTALYTLKKIYSDSKVYSIFPTSFINGNSFIAGKCRIINQGYRKEGIIIEILDL